jgi:ribosomal protein S14
MAKYFFKDYEKRIKFKNFEFKQKILKTLVFNSKLSTIIRRKLSWQYSRLCFLSSFTFFKNKCVLSGRSRSIYCFFNLSRLVIKIFYKLRYIPGLTKSS